MDMDDVPSGIIIVLVLALFTWLIVSAGTAHHEQKTWCEEAGGVAVVGDRGKFKVCLDPSAVIERP